MLFAAAETLHYLDESCSKDILSDPTKIRNGMSCRPRGFAPGLEEHAWGLVSRNDVCGETFRNQRVEMQMRDQMALDQSSSDR